MHQARNDLVFVRLGHALLRPLEVRGHGELYSHIRLGTEDSMIALHFELFLLIQFTLALFNLKVEEAVRLACPCDGADQDLGHLDFCVVWR